MVQKTVGCKYFVAFLAQNGYCYRDKKLGASRKRYSENLQNRDSKAMKEEVVLLLDMKGLRKEAGVSVDQVADQADIPRSNIDRIEEGKGTSLISALKLARFLQMPVEEIWGLKEK